MANSEVHSALRQTAERQSKRGEYNKFNPETRAAIGKCAVMNGVSATARFFSRKLKHPVSTSTVLSIKKLYMEERDRQRESGAIIRQLPLKKRGRPLLLGEIDSRVQAYLQKVRENGGVIYSRIVMSAARGLVF